GTTAPVESRTVPFTDAVETWPRAAVETSRQARKKTGETPCTKREADIIIHLPEVGFQYRIVCLRLRWHVSYTRPPAVNYKTVKSRNASVTRGAGREHRCRSFPLLICHWSFVIGHYRSYFIFCLLSFIILMFCVRCVVFILLKIW